MYNQLEQNQSSTPKSYEGLNRRLFGNFSESTVSHKDAQDSVCQFTPPKTVSRKEVAGRFMSEDLSCAESLESQSSSIWKKHEQAALSHLQGKQASVITITKQDYAQNSLGSSVTGEYYQNKLRKLLPLRKQSSTQSSSNSSDADLFIPRSMASQTGTACSPSDHPRLRQRPAADRISRQEQARLPLIPLAAIPRSNSTQGNRCPWSSFSSHRSSSSNAVSQLQITSS